MKNIIAKRDDIAFYVKLFPLSIHKEAYGKAKSIVCKNSLQLLEDNFAGKKIETVECDSKEVDETITLAGSLGIRGTPAIILPDGRLRSGAIPEQDLINMIDGKL